MSPWRISAVLGTALLALTAWLSARTVAIDLATPRDAHGTPHATSTRCRHCHESHYASWASTFHRTMTQEAAAPGAVLGAFDGRSIRYLGVDATMERTPSGEPRVTFTDATGAVVRRAIIERTVGSRRYQQYLARDGDVLLRLPVAWSVADARFFHMNGAFLGADPDEPTAHAAGIPDGYDRHLTRWNDNCVFCHNVAPRPGWSESSQTFTTEVAELGVACEACHGPGDAHAAANANPLRRYALHLSGARDPTITNPSHLSGLRSAEICARCHGQRLAPDVSIFLTRGDPFVPGDDLSDYSTPLSADTPLHGDPTAFADRFWRDGTARLTAFEHQGYLDSPCRADEAFSCTSCHAMHDGDPRGQLRPDAVGDGACTQCHESLDAAPAMAAHARHDAQGEGARCVACHMPRIVYGLVDVHRSHRVEVPDPAQNARDARPDACTLCHVDETRSWAIDAYAQMFGRSAARVDTTRNHALPDDAVGLAEVARALAGGDPIERAVAAHAIGRTDASTARANGAERDQRLARLLDAVANERFPAVRRIAARSAAQLAPSAAARAALRAYEATAPADERARALAGARALLPVTARALSAKDAAHSATLRDSAPGRDIVIGE